MYGGMNGTDNVTFNDIFELQTGECPRELVGRHGTWTA